jgi:hypothetical protein
MVSDFLCQLSDFPGQFRIVLFEHIADPDKMVPVVHQHFIHRNLVLRKAFDDPVVKSGSSAVFA